MTEDPRVVSVQVGRPRTATWLGRELTTSIVKEPVQGPVRVGPIGLDGDEQADRAQHGGPDKAVYAYALEDLQWWEAELRRPAPPGMFGENLTVTGLALGDVVIGERWRIGTTVLQVSEPRTPCWKLGYRWQDPGFPRRVAKSRRTGVLLRVLAEGHLQAGDPVVVGDRPAHGITVALVNRIYYGEERDVSPLHAAPELAAHWRAWADHRTVWHLDEETKFGVGP